MKYFFLSIAYCLFSLASFNEGARYKYIFRETSFILKIDA